MTSSVLTRNYLFKVSNWSTRIRCEMCSLRRGHCSSVENVNCKHISNFLIVIGFEQTKDIFSCWKDKTFWRQDQVYHALCCSHLVWPKFIKKWFLKLYHHKPRGESVRNFCEGVYFRLWFCLKRCRWHWKWPAAHLSFYHLLFIDFARWKTTS